jgi:cell wall-associated NlpC family hydrolase
MCKKIKASLILVFTVVCQLAAGAREPLPSVRSIVESALDKSLDPHKFQQKFHGLDCSHLVHAVYRSLGLNYRYATSRTLYGGITPFERVKQPGLGDLVVWRGHVGIVVDPSEHRFLSALRSGVKVASYLSGYWQRRGHPRFFRYGVSSGISATDPDSTIASVAAR